MTPNDLRSGEPTSQEPIPGYRLIERLGRGGYGEVWKTLAPGGVPKAIKLIFGDDSARMATELRSLNRIKDIRHPFLLSIERIEQQGEMLAIVTELGDKNLQQYFQDCLARDLPGIPQDDLLEKMRDVADVLDYIYQEFALQHLDVKPANLLLFGNRLKVADFGLVKNIYEPTASMVHGLTPTYAAPEIFDGRPSRSSDQYSLAIMYQEMLTGILPHNGLTAARLAAQHLKDAPDLSPLPSEQRMVIARALSKDPNQRFSSCRELVDELVAATRRAQSVPVQNNRRETPAAREMAGARSASSIPVITTQSRPGATSPVPPALKGDSQGDPTIVVGIGGTAGKLFQRLRLRMTDRLGGVNSIAGLKLLLVDLDNETLNEANQDHRAWSELQTVATPLRSSAEYRENGHLHRRWLSRRWLYNVPRDLRTEGLRPLGRLALMSNASRVLAALRTAIEQVTDNCPGKTPRVLVIGSLAGGTGSGMLLDLAYAARNELRVAGFSDASVDGLLFYSTPIGGGRDKAVLNAIATLCELNHYSARGSFYPGEPLLHVPPIHGNNRTFDSTQLLHLGEDLDSTSWLFAVDNAAEHVYCRLMTGIDRTMIRPADAGDGSGTTLDFILSRQIGGYAGSFVDELTRQLCVDLLDTWCGTALQPCSGDHSSTSTATILNAIEDIQNSKNQPLTDETEAKLVSFGVDQAQLLRRAREMLQQELKLSPRDYLQSQLDEVIKAVSDETPNHELARLAISLQDRAIGLDFGERAIENSRNTLFDMLQARLSPQIMPIAGRFIEWLCQIIDQPTGSVDMALHAAEVGRDRIRELITGLNRQIRDRHTQQADARIMLLMPPDQDDSARSQRGWLMRRGNPRAALMENLIEHGLSSFDELVEVQVHLQLRAIESHISTVIDHLVNMRFELKQLGKRISAPNPAVPVERSHPSNFERTLQRWLIVHRRQLVQILRNSIEQSVLTGPRKLQRLLQQRCSLEQTLGEPLVHHARQVVLHSIEQGLSRALQHQSTGANGRELEIDSALAEILREPWLMDGGDYEQSVMVVPAVLKTQEFYSKSSKLPPIPMVSGKTNNVTLIRQRGGVTIPSVLQSITHGQEALMTIAANLHSRVDVEWNAESAMNVPAPEVEAPAAWAEISQTVALG